jgi:hypothetical protein
MGREDNGREDNGTGELLRAKGEEGGIIGVAGNQIGDGFLCLCDQPEQLRERGTKSQTIMSD